MAAAEARLVSLIGGGGGSALSVQGAVASSLAGPGLRLVSRGDGVATPGRSFPTRILLPRDAACVVTAFAAAPSGAMLAVAEAGAGGGGARIAFYSLESGTVPLASGLSVSWLGDIDVGDLAVRCMEFG